jgi:hypothetical protein
MQSFDGDTWGKRLLARSRRRWETIIKVKEIVWEDVDGIDLTGDSLL